MKSFGLQLVTLADGSQQTFADFFSSTPLFRSAEASPRWLTVSELLDPTVALHRSFFSERLPPPALCADEASLGWLRRAGMRDTLTRVAFYEAALQVHEQAVDAMAAAVSVSPAVIERAEQIVGALVSSWSGLSHDETQRDQ